MTPEENQHIRRRAEAALKVVYELAATGGEAWRMSIPAQAQDTDLLLGSVCESVPALIDALEAAESRTARLTAALRGILTKQAFQPRAAGLNKECWYCQECEYFWLDGEPEQHAPKCDLVAWRELAEQMPKSSHFGV